MFISLKAILCSNLWCHFSNVHWHRCNWCQPLSMIDKYRMPCKQDLQDSLQSTKTTCTKVGRTQFQHVPCDTKAQTPLDTGTLKEIWSHRNVQTNKPDTSMGPDFFIAPLLRRSLPFFITWLWLELCSPYIIFLWSFVTCHWNRALAYAYFCVTPICPKFGHCHFAALNTISLQCPIQEPWEYLERFLCYGLCP